MRKQAQDAIGAPRPRQPLQQRSDGQDGPLILPPPGAVVSGTPVNSTGPNAALKEAPQEGDGLDPQHPCRGRVTILDADQALIQETAPDGSPRRKIAVCGFASSTRRYIPVHDPSWSIWGLNQLNRHIPRADRWFDIHHNWNEEVVPGTDHFAFARDCGMPFYMLHRHPELPTSVRYPIDAVLAAFDADYFTSTIAYMVALAILEIDRLVRVELREGIRRTPKRQLEALDLLEVVKRFYARYAIGIFGVDLVVAEEYFWQKACAEFWIGQAGSRGIKVVIPPESALCKQQVRYGYDPEPQQLLKLAEIDAHEAMARAERDELMKRLCMLEGVIQADQRWHQVIELRSRGTKVD